MKGLLKKVLVGAICVFSLVGLTACDTQGLTEEQTKTMFDTLEKSQEFMNEVSDSIDDKLRQDKNYITELRRQNDLKEQEIELQAQANAKITKEEALARFKRAYFNYQTNKDGLKNNSRFLIEYSEPKNAGQGEFSINEITDQDGSSVFYVLINQRFTFEGITQTRRGVGYATKEEGGSVEFDTETKISYESIISGYYNILNINNIFTYIDMFNSKLDAQIDSVKVLENNDLEIITFWHEDHDGEDWLNFGQVIISEEDYISSFTIDVFCDGNFVRNDSISFEYNVQYNNAEFMRQYNEILDGYEIKLPTLFRAMKDIQNRNDLTISFEGEDESWRSIDEFVEANPGSELIFNWYQNYSQIKNTNRVDEHVLTYTYPYSMINNSNENVTCEIVYTVTDGKLTKITIVYDEDNKPTLNIAYPAENND